VRLHPLGLCEWQKRPPDPSSSSAQGNFAHFTTNMATDVHLAQLDGHAIRRAEIMLALLLESTGDCLGGCRAIRKAAPWRGQPAGRHHQSSGPCASKFASKHKSCAPECTMCMYLTRRQSIPVNHVYPSKQPKHKKRPQELTSHTRRVVHERSASALVVILAVRTHPVGFCNFQSPLPSEQVNIAVPNPAVTVA
jgi:hypothetical protein